MSVPLLSGHLHSYSTLTHTSTLLERISFESHSSVSVSELFEYRCNILPVLTKQIHCKVNYCFSIDSPVDFVENDAKVNDPVDDGKHFSLPIIKILDNRYINLLLYLTVACFSETFKFAMLCLFFRFC